MELGAENARACEDGTLPQHYYEGRMGPRLRVADARTALLRLTSRNACREKHDRSRALQLSPLDADKMFKLLEAARRSLNSFAIPRSAESANRGQRSLL
jgi:hypothetical protein